MIYTIGHSIHSVEDFISLLKGFGVSAIADVRSAPYSRFQPQFNRETLSAMLFSHGIEYVFLGDQIGGRSNDSEDFENNRVVYSRLKSKPSFQAGINRVISGSLNFSLALMCSEKEPLECHRTLLISQTLQQAGQEVAHIHSDGSLEFHAETMARLLKLFKLDEPDLFRTEIELLEEALLRQELKVAFTNSESPDTNIDRELPNNSEFGDN